MIAATIIASFGRQFVVRSNEDLRTFTAVTRGKRGRLAVGDQVILALLGGEQAVIDQVSPRRNTFRRSDLNRTKLLAANIDQAAIVIAGEPSYSEEILLRVMMAGAAESIPVAVIVNKQDLVEAGNRIAPRAALYRALGYQVFDVAAGADPAAMRALLLPWLTDRTTLLLGESGMGKSTLINGLVPDAQLRTQTISAALGSGRHTTTFTRLFELPEDCGSGRIIDSPGFQSFGLEHLSESERVHAMPEFAALLGQCRFHNCTHGSEPACAIRAAVEAGDIDNRRYRIFVRLAEEARAIARANPDRA